MPWQVKELFTMKREFCGVCATRGKQHGRTLPAFRHQQGVRLQWLRAFEEEGDSGLEERSRRPLSHPLQTAQAMEQVVLELRAQHPAWGGRKLKRRLERLRFEGVPAASTITEILRRHGQLRYGGSQAQGPWQRFEYGAPNELWQMDFKGPLKLVNAGRCDILTLLDDHSRYSLAVEACVNQQSQTVKGRLSGAFGRYGLPQRILSDNGSPWGSAEAACPYTELGVWLLRLGVELIHGRPYYPQTQGKQERFHGSLQVEVLNQSTVWRDLEHCQRRFSQFRQCYNYERPHEALQMEVPASRYRPSLRAMPANCLPLSIWPRIRCAESKPKARSSSRGHLLYVGQAFDGLDVAFRAGAQEDCWELFSVGKGSVGST